MKSRMYSDLISVHSALYFLDNNKRGYPFPIKTVLTGISLILQLALLIVPVLFFSKSAIWFYSACQVLSICFVIYIINCPSNPSYKITWITFILTLPVMGVVVFLLFGGGRVFPHLKKRMKKCAVGKKMLKK